jgi:hypothetical protein
MEMINRYVYAVTHKLPEKQRADIEKEVRGLIEDMLDERVPDGEVITQQHVEDILHELGDPYDLAVKYRGVKRYLISPEIFDIYLTVLKVVAYSIWIGLSVVFAIEFILNPMNVIEQFTSYLVSIITVSIQGFAWVTIIFALMEYAGVNVAQIGNASKATWKPSQLQPIPNPKTQIKSSEAITGIIFAVLFMVLFIFSRDLLGIHRLAEGERTFVPFLNEAVFKQYLPFVYVWLGIGLLRECLKLVTKKWSMKLSVYFVLFNIISFVIALIVFQDQAVWNPDFMNEMVQSGLIVANSDGFETVNNIWSSITEGIVYFIAALLIIDSVHVLFKGVQAKK